MPTKPKREIPTTPKKTRVFDQKFISPAQLAKRWDLSESSIYHGNADAKQLTRIPFGRSIRFLLSEVEALEAKKLSLATAHR